MSRTFLKACTLAAGLGLLMAACRDAPTTVRQAPTPQFTSIRSANGLGACMGDNALAFGVIGGMSGPYDLNCTANDIDIAEARVTAYRVGGVGNFTNLVPGDTIECTPGQTIDIVTFADLENNAQARYDIGVWIGVQDSTQALHGSCLQYNLVNGVTGVANLDSDKCGDMAAGGLTSVSLDTLHVTCENNPSGTVALPACIGWQNSVDGDIRVCPTSAAGADTLLGYRWGTTPETKSKCNCRPLSFPIAVRGVLRIHKTTVPSPDASATSFAFTTTGTGYTTPFSLKNDSTNSSNPLRAGTYTAAETVPLGWTLLSRSCVLTGSSTPKTFSSITNGVSVALGAGEDVTCTFTNRKNPKLTLVKRIVNDNGGTATVSDFAITTTAPGVFSFGSGAADGASTLKYTTNTVTTDTGTFTLHEGTLTGYTEGTWGCTSGLVSGNAQTGSVRLVPGDSVTCTITNNDQGASLILVKRIVNDNGGTKVVGDFGITTSAGALTFGAGVADGANTLKYTSNTLSVNAGSYTFSENNVAGYTEGTWSCTPVAATGTAYNGGSVTLGLGQTTTCTITNNDDQGSLTLVKRIVNANGGTKVVGDFGITTTAGALTFGAGVADGANTLKYTSNKLAVNAASYNFSELNVAGYTEGTWSCTPTAATGTAYNAGSVTVGNGVDVTCTITNSDQPASLTLVKRITNDNGGTKVVGDFGITTNAGALTFGAGVADGANTLKYTSNTLSVNAGSYTFSENNVAGYTEGTWSCTPVTATGTAYNAGSVTLANGDAVTCTITNNDDQGSLTLVKRIVNAYGGAKVVGDFGITTTAGALTFGAGVADGANTLKYTSNKLAVNAASYNFSELNVAGYTEGTWSCTPTAATGTAYNAGSVTVGNGVDVTCTITNSDQPATLKVVKVVKGGSATFAFAGTGTGVSANFSLTPPADAADTTIFANIAAGLKSITETVTSGYTLTDLGCSDQPVGTYDPALTQTVSTTLVNGGTVTCTFVNEQNANTTRTQGFWATHMSLTNAVWFGGTIGGNTFTGVTDPTLCAGPSKTLDTIAKVLGGFWSSISMTTDKTKRSSLDQARMRLLQQLLAAMLNHAAFGSSPTGSISIADAEAAYCGTDESAIQDAMTAMASFNESGDNGLFTPGVSANGKAAKAAANLTYWDALP